MKAQILEVWKKNKLGGFHTNKFVYFFSFNFLTSLLQYINFHSVTSIQVTPLHQWHLDNVFSQPVLGPDLKGLWCIFFYPFF